VKRRLTTARICFVCQSIYGALKNGSEGDRFGYGGAEVQQLLIGKELARRGHAVSYITLKQGQKEMEQIDKFQVMYTFNPNEGIPILRFVYPRVAKIWKALRRSDADIFYDRGANFILAVVVWYAKLNRKKVIFCGASDSDFDRKSVPLHHVRDRILYRWGLRRCDSIVVQNSKQKRLLIQNFGRSGHIIYNGYSNTKYHTGIKKEILWVGTVKKIKNPQILLELAERIPTKKFVMIGGKRPGDLDDERFYNDISEKAKHLANVDFKGFLPIKEVEKRFMCAKLFLNTSEYEGFPNTFLQAWSAGIPVISFTDPDDLIRKNHVGLVVENVDEMTHKVKDVSENNLAFPSDKIRSFFQNNFTIEKIVDDYEKLLSAVWRE
jgi:glycosyltransferase involved in cell wall biosynthesis